MGKLNGKAAIVTGASRGIGAAIAECFAAEGAKVIATARTLQEGTHPLPGSLEMTIQNIRAAGGEATAVAGNVSEYEECEAIVQACIDTYGPPDVLVNNAALTYFIPVKDFPVRRWLRSTAVNFHGPFYLSQLCLNLGGMIERGAGAIVNVSSAAAIGPGRGPYEGDGGGGTLYGAEKAALERFTQGLASEVHQYGVSVTCYSPSQIVPTPGVVFHKLMEGRNPNEAESVEVMAQAALLLATEPLDAAARPARPTWPAPSRTSAARRSPAATTPRPRWPSGSGAAARCSSCSSTASATSSSISSMKRPRSAAPSGSACAPSSPPPPRPR